jgi:glycosyltransferase involved in cell wall biosynthesis
MPGEPVSEPLRVHFAYWGRRGGGARMALELARAAIQHPGLSATISVSSSNEMLPAFTALGDAVLSLDTFDSNAGALTKAWRLPALQRQLIARLRADRTQAFVTLMPHVWSPLIAPAIRRAGVSYATIVHDGAAHPGDATGLVHGWLLRDAARADLVITLSGAVKHHLTSAGRVAGKPVVTLFTPDMGPGLATSLPRACPFPEPGQPFRIAFVGRIMPYKGLPLLVEAVRLLRQDGVPVALGVFGSGELGDMARELMRLDAHVENHWLAEDGLAKILEKQHAVVLSHTEASQSGVAALATGHGVPLIATPIGGLVEQVQDGHNGILAEAVTAEALAAAIRKLARDRALYVRLCDSIRQSRGERSAGRFLDALLAILPVRKS